jgi:hypothetical protein
MQEFRMPAIADDRNSAIDGLQTVNEMDDLTAPSSAWAKAMVLQLQECLEKSLNTSNFLLIEKTYRELCSSLDTYSLLQDNWDSYGAERPSTRSIEAASRFLRKVHSDLFMPSRVIPSAEGGMAVYFSTPGKTAYIEYRNSGEVIMAMYDEKSEPIVLELDGSDADDARACSLIRRYISEPSHSSER